MYVFAPGQTNSIYTENATEVVYMIYNFLCLEGEGGDEAGSRFNEGVGCFFNFTAVYFDDNLIPSFLISSFCMANILITPGFIYG